MSKAHWLTMVLDGAVEDNRRVLIDMSYDLTKG